MPKKTDLSDSGYPVFSGYGIVGFAHSYHYEHPEVIIVARGVGGTGDVKFSPPKCFLTNLSIAAQIACPQVDKHFLFYRLNYPSLWALRTGAAQAQITIERLNRHEVDIPPLPTQRKIASVLSAYDDHIENNTRRIAILEEMAQSLYREWFVELRFPGHENARFVDSPLGKIPEGWKAAMLGDVVSNFDRLRKPLSSMQRADMKGEYPYYGAAKIFDYINDYIFEGKYLLLAEDGSVITTDRKPVLQMAYGKFWVNNHAHILQGRPPVCTEQLCVCLSATDVSAYVTGAAQPKITQANMNRMPFLVATDDVQSAFADLIVPFFDEMHLLDRKNATLRQTRDLLLPKLISGQLDVEDLDIDVGDSLAEATA
jgi:type I restriction enzyme S subunit